jgi:O-antigen ligase
MIFNYPSQPFPLVYLAGLTMFFDNLQTTFYGALRSRKNLLYEALGIILSQALTLSTGTRGTIVGLFASVVVSLGIIAWFEKGKARKTLVIALGAMAIIVASIFIFKNTEFIQKSPTLSRIASISPTDITTMSRFTIWKVSYDAWKERPLLGYGQDNFTKIYAERFIGEKMWNLEAWYDRSHNVFFDWLVAGGILGLLSYLSIFGIAFYVMWRKDSHMSLREKALITGALVGYFIHNVFVFDNLISYILFILILGYIIFATENRTYASHKTQVVLSRIFSNINGGKCLWLLCLRT